jgi:hypothetical protein
MSPSRILDASTEFCYNFYLTPVVIDSTCLCVTFRASTRIRIVLDTPEDGANLATWIDDIRDVHDEETEAVAYRDRRSLMHHKTSNLDNVYDNVYGQSFKRY